MKRITLLIYFACSSFFMFGQYQKNVILQDHWTDTTLLLAVEDARFNDIWGFEFNGENYCAVGTSEGVTILHVGEDELTYVDDAPGTYVGFNVVHRDMKTYKDHLYLVGDEGTSNLQIFDLSFLPDSIHEVYNSDTLVGTAHNVWIDTVTAKLYSCGSITWVLDISSPADPQVIQPFAAGYVHDAFVRNDTAFFNMADFGLLIVDFSAGGSYIGVLDFYPGQGYNHSGWWSPSGEKYVFADETEGTKLKLCYIDDPAMVQVDETFGTADYQDFLPHNVYITDELAFVSYYNEGLRIYDLTKTPIKEVGAYDTFLEDTQYKLNGAWGVYVFEETDQIIISDRQNGIFLFEFPIQAFSVGAGTVVTNNPFIDENGYLIPKDYLTEAQLKFNVYALSGERIYVQENYLNWMQMPLDLSAGVYYFGIYDDAGELLESGKFVKIN